MSSYITIEIDTTPPEIEILSPKYTTKDMKNTIIIESNENLSTFQDIFIVDSFGTKHKYVFKRETNKVYKGIVSFNNYPTGVATIYAQMRDEVDNSSKIVSTQIEIKEGISLLVLDIRDVSMESVINSRSSSIIINDRADKTTIEQRQN